MPLAVLVVPSMSFTALMLVFGQGMRARGGTAGPARCQIKNPAEEALQAWLEKAAIDHPAEAQQAARGYQWKSLFLPHGTLLRFNYRRYLGIIGHL